MSKILIVVLLLNLCSGEQLLNNKDRASVIAFPNGMMDNSLNEYSICTWVRDYYNFNFPHVHVRVKYPDQEYDPSDDHDLMYSDFFSSTYRYISGGFVDIKPGTWYHACFVQNKDNIIRGYINGEQFAMKHTEDWSNGTLILEEGTETYFEFGHGEYWTYFTGDLFKFNIHNRTLTEREIKSMASMCTCEEDKLASAKILEWEQLLTYAGYPPPVEFDAEEIVPA